MSECRNGLFIGFLIACATLYSVSPARSEGTLEKIKRTGVFLAGVRFDFPPVGTIDVNGRPVGFGPDLAKAVADKLGVSVTYVQANSQNRIALLQNGQIDAELGITTPTKRREEVVDFTIPYVWDSTTLLIHKGDDPNPLAYGPPKKVAATQGGITTDVFRKIVPNATFVLFQEYPDAFTALRNHKVDAVVLNKAATGLALGNDPQLAVSNDIEIDPWAIMVREDDSKWRKYLDWTLQEMWANGDYQRLYARWFGGPPQWHMWSEYELQPGIGKN